MIVCRFVAFEPRRYHQVKFIERQKVTRLEKSVRRELQKLKEEHSTDNDEARQEKIAKLQAQLNATAMDQLYIAFYPADVKYMSLFTNGMQRAVDDERGQKRRKNIWNRIREGLLNDRKNENVDGIADEEDGAKKKVQLDNAKNWINLDAAKKALLSMPEDTYPNAPSLLPIVSHQRQQSMGKQAKRESTEGKSAAKATASDDRFVFSKELDGLFHESTTGDDYEKEVEVQDAIRNGIDDDDSKDSDVSSDSDESDSSSEDDADPLKGYAESKVSSSDRKGPSSDDEDKVEISTNKKAADEEVSSSSSSSDDSDSSDSDSEAAPSNTKGNADTTSSIQKREDDEEEDDDDDQDDFFTTEKVSTEEVFAQAQKQQHKERAADDNYTYQKKRSDKSKGFATQNQTKREFRNFQHRKKRSKFG